MITTVLFSNQYEAIDFFFSAFMEDQSILASYINLAKTFSLLDFVTKSSTLPVSYLKFLLFIDNQPELTETQILSFFAKSPLLTFEFIERFRFDQLSRIWKLTLNSLFSIPIDEMDSQLIDSQLNILYCFIQSSLMHLNLVSLVTKNVIHRIFSNVFFLNETVNFSEQKWPILLIILIFSRIDDDVAMVLAESSEFERFLRKIVLNVNEKFELLKNYFFWVLNPTSPFPIEGIMPLHAKYVSDNLKYPSVTFSKKIAPVLFSLLLIKAFSGSLTELEFNDFTSSLIEMWNESKNKNLQYNIFLGLSNEEALKLLVPLSMKNSTCFDLLKNSLSFSCQFSTFSMVYEKIGEDHQKFLEFLTILAKQTPIVNDFVRLKRTIELPVDCYEKTVIMWIRIIKENSTIAIFQLGKNSTFVIKYQMNTFIFDVNQKKIMFINSDLSIEGWYFISINFTKDVINASVNLGHRQQVTIKTQIDSPVTMSFGENKSVFDFQCVRVFHSILNENQIKYCFFLGPNIKRMIVDNLSCIQMSEKSFLYGTSDGYLSSIYSSWISQVKYLKSANYSSDFRLEYDISPPFISNEELFYKNELNLEKERFHLQPFFNSLEAFGGFRLLIHIFAEIILYEKELHELMFDLIFVLLNRFPFVHHLFVKNKYYQIIGQLLKKTSEKVDFEKVMKCAILNIDDKKDNNSNSPVFSNMVISNSEVLKYWILSPSIFYNDTNAIIENIYESLQSKYEEYNLNIIFHSSYFSFISNSFLISTKYSNQIFELLISLRLKITTKENVNENINTIIQCLLDYHFSSKGKNSIKNENNNDINNENDNNNDNKNNENENNNRNINDNDDNNNENENNNRNINDNDDNNNENKNDDNKNDDNKNDDTNANNENDENNEKSEILLLNLLIKIFNKFPESIYSSSLEELLPLLTRATINVKIEIFDILMKYLNPQHYSDFILALQYSKPDRQFIERIFINAFKFINKSENVKTANFHYITIPLLYFVYHIEIAEDFLISFCTGLNQALQIIPKYPELMMNHIFRLFYLLLKKKSEIAAKHLEPKFDNSFTRIPQLLLMYITFISLGVFKSYDQSYNLTNFLLDILLIDYGKYSIFILSSVIDNLKVNADKNSEIVGKFVDFCFIYLIVTIQLRIDQKVKEPPPYIQIFVISSIQIINHLFEKFKMKNMMPHFIPMISEIKTNYPDIYSSFEDDFNRCKIHHMKKKSMINKSKINDSYENYKEYLSIRKEEILRCIENYKNIDQKSRLKDFYDRKIAEKQESNEGLINSWKSIFNVLHFPGSLVHKNYPEKYKIDEFSKKYQIHRVLFPVNPAYERFYSDNWSEKYSEEEPQIKLTMKDVVGEIGFSHSSNILFSEKILFHHGVKSIEGHFTMSNKKLRFYFPSKINELIFKLNDISRIILNEYQHQPSAFSVEDKYENLYSFTFMNKIIRNDFIEKTKKIFKKKKIKIIQRFSVTELNSKKREWENGNLSNFEYLIDLNFISGRSWSDFTRYPIFPWVFSGLNDIKEDKSSKIKKISSNAEKSNLNESASNIDIDKSSDFETGSSMEEDIPTNKETTSSFDFDNSSKIETTTSIEVDDSNKIKSLSTMEVDNSSKIKSLSSIEVDDSNKIKSLSTMEVDNSSIVKNTSIMDSDNLSSIEADNESIVDSDLESELNFIKITSEEAEVEMTASSPLFMPSENDDSLNHSLESISYTYRSDPMKSADNALASTGTESVDNSEIDVSLTSTSEEAKPSQSPLFQVTIKPELKAAKSSPTPMLVSSSPTPHFGSIMSVPLSILNSPFVYTQTIHNSSSEKTLKLAHSASSIISSESSYKLDDQMYQKYRSTNQEQKNDRPLFRIKNFEDIFSIHSKSQYIMRNLCLPFFAQTLRQQQSCKKYYNLTKRIENDPHHYSSYLSNISSALYFLVRLEPSTTFEIDHQDGKLDAADRTFQSLELTLQVMSSPDSRSAIELIPEFFFMPEILMNINGINFPLSPIHKRVINDVIVPNWAKNHFQYVRFLRKLLESEQDSCTLNVWIDMVWGKRRQGKLAYEHFNTFQKIVFNFNPDLYSNNPKLLTAFQTQIVNCGQAPFELFAIPHPRKNFQPKKRKLDVLKLNEASKSCESPQKLNAQNFSHLIDLDDVGLIVTKYNQVIFAHKNVPILSLWKFVDVDGPDNDSKSRMTMRFVDLMRGNLVKVTALDFSDNRFFVAGHFDGKLSTFCLNSCVHFLRIIECPLNFPVSMVKVMNDNSSIITFQNFLDKNNKMNSCLVSLFSINGLLIEKLMIEDHAIDCALSSLFNGIQKNYAFILTENGKIIALSMNSLKIKMQMETMRNDLVSLYLKDNFLLSVVTNSNITLTWRLF